MKLNLIFPVIIVALFNIGWSSWSGSNVVSEENVVSATSIEATQVLTSNTLTNLNGETRLGGTSNYVSFSSAGVVSFSNVAVSTVIGLKNDDKLSWLGSDGLTSYGIGVSTNDAFVVPTSLDVTGVLSADSLEVDSFDATEASFDSLGVSNQIIASGNSTFVGVSIDNVTTGGLTATKADVTTATITTGTLTTATISGGTVSADNVTTTGATVTNLDVTSLDTTVIEADYYRTSSGVSGITSNYTVATTGCIVSVDSGIITNMVCS